MKKTLIQLDTDGRPNVFDSMVAIDSGIDFLLTHQHVDVKNVESIVHGAMFTRGPNDLKNTAIFIGGSDVSDGEKLLKRICKCFFGPIRVSVMLDSNGCNTTAAAAVLSASRHLDLKASRALVLAGTGPVGIRAAQILAKQGADVTISSRSFEKAEFVAQTINKSFEKDLSIQPCGISNSQDLQSQLEQNEVVIAAGAAGVCLWPKTVDNYGEVKVAIDLNAVAPNGIEMIEVADKGKDQDGLIRYGAIGVGGLKMKIHKQAIKQLFNSNDHVVDVDEIFQIGRELEAK